MKPSMVLSALAFLILLALIPFVFAEVMLTSLAKLHLNPGTAGLIMVGIFAGGLINIPIKRYARDEHVSAHPLSAYGLNGFWPRLKRARAETVIAINIGGCVIPTLLAIYELSHILEGGGVALAGAVALACVVNIAVCYWLAEPIPEIGIALPGFVPPIVAVLCALVLAPDAAAPVAFIAGVTGPLIGADLLHLREIKDMAIGVASIGGAGTFDGIVLSGILAAYLA